MAVKTTKVLGHRGDCLSAYELYLKYGPVGVPVPFAERFFGVPITVNIAVVTLLLLLLITNVVLCFVEPSAIAVTACEGAVVWCLYLCVFGHELGHFWAMERSGVSVERIHVSLLWAFVSLQKGQTARLLKEHKHTCTIALAGPLVNIVLLLVCYAASLVSSQPETYYVPILFNGVMCLNLLPINPLDGGKLVYALIAWGTKTKRAIMYSSMLSVPCAFVVVCVGWRFDEWLLVVMASVACVFNVVIAVQEGIELGCCLRPISKVSKVRANPAVGNIPTC